MGACCLLYPMASSTPLLPTCHATNDAHPKMSGHLAVQLRSIAPQSFILLGQLRERGEAKSSVLTCSMSWGGQFPALLPSHHRIPDPVWASGTPLLTGSRAPSPFLVRVSFCAEQMGTSCLGTTTLPAPRPREKMHHRSREQSPPGCGTAPFSERQVKV